MRAWSAHKSRWVFVVGVALWCAGLGSSFVWAQSKTAALDLVAKAAKALEAGAYTDAKTSIDEAFKLGLDNELSARAMLIRAQANEKTGQLVGALSDYSGALFMQTLSTSERKKATAGKERVSAAMGLSSNTQAKKTQTSSQPATSSEGTSSSGISGFFNNLFGSNEKPKPAAAKSETTFQTQTATEQPKPASPPPAKSPAPSQSPSQTETTAPKPQSAVAKPSAKTAEAKPVNQPTIAKSVAAKPERNSPTTGAAVEGGFLIDFGTSASDAMARSKAQQIKSQLADILVNRDLIVRSSGGGYRIVAGPYKTKNSAASLCSAMKSRGVSCQVTP